MRMRNFVWPIFCLAVIALSGCGGGTAPPSPAQGTNDGSIFTTGGANPIAAPTKGVLKLTAGAAGTIAGIDMTINLPAGVTVAADPVTGEVTTGVVTVSGVAAAGTLGTQNATAAKYTPATAATPAQLHIVMAIVPGFSLGEFATVHFDLATGTALPTAEAFTVAGFAARGADGLGLSGVSAAPASVAGI
jgi:hypothetical protein